MQMRQLATEHARLATGRAHADDAALEARLEALSEQMEPHIAILEAQSEQLEANAEPLEALSRRMEEASEPMEVLSVKMEALSAQHEQDVEAAEKELQAVITAAMAQGLARPAADDNDTP